MKHSNLIVGILIGLVVAGGLFAWRGAAGQNASDATGATPRRELQIAHALPTGHPVHQGIEAFAKRLEALSGGRITCTIFPSGQRGSETECLEKLQTGSLDFTKTSTAPVSNFVPVFSVFSLPYLFNDAEHYWDVLEGEIGREILDRSTSLANGQPSGMVALCYMDAGSRNFYSNAPILTPADVAGKTIRTMRDPIAIAMIGAMGGKAEPMPFGELYSALQQGNVDGAENNPPSFVESRHVEVCKQFTFDHHTRNPDLFIASQALWEKLSDQEKEWVRTAASEASRVQRKLWKDGTRQALKTMREEGVTIHEPDLKPFQEATAPVIEEFATGEVAELVERIRNVAEEDTP